MSLCRLDGSRVTPEERDMLAARLRSRGWGASKTCQVTLPCCGRPAWRRYSWHFTRRAESVCKRCRGAMARLGSLLAALGGA